MLKNFFASICAALVVCVVASSVDAGSVNLQLIKDPAAVGCAGCTLSGPGTYQLYAKIDAADAVSTGIAGFGISVQGVSSVLHRSPRVNSSEDSGGNINPAGFTLLRSANNAVVTGTGFLIGAGQDTVTPTPYIVQGFGKTDGSFAAILPAGNTNTGIIQPTWTSNLLLAEGSYSGTLPDIDLANVDVFVNLFGAGGAIAPATLAKEICTVSCGGVVTAPSITDFTDTSDVLNKVVSTTLTATGTAPITWSDLSGFVYTPGFGALPAAPGLSKQPTWNPATQAFNWDVSGSSRGTYKWNVNATNSAGTDQGLITVEVRTVPEPATFAMVGLALVGCVGFARRRS